MTIKGFLFRVFTATVIAAALGVLLIPAAYHERGYMAIGGEWLCVILAWVAALWVLCEE